MSRENGQHGEEVLIKPPAHPVSALQGPFEESMLESVNEASDFDVPIDAITRRALLLDSPFYQRVIAGRWRQKPGEKYHPLWKLIAQMSFGIHLLARNMAKSEDEVMKILQAHVDDIDGFLERTCEDFDLAQSDMHERLRCLKLPLQHGEVFDRMLEDPAFRGSILDGNEKIEHIVHRTKRFMKDSLKDVQKGFDATSVLEKYLHKLATSWVRQTPEHEAVFVAMQGNVEGWRKAFMELHLQGNKLGGTLKKLTQVVNEMAKRANVVSQSLVERAKMMANPHGQSISSRSQIGSMRGSQIHKPLPTAPNQMESSRRSSNSIKHLDDSSSPKSNSRSSQVRSSGSSKRQQALQEAVDVRDTPTPMSTTLLGSTTTSRADTPMKGLVPILNINEQTASEDDLAVELPADVPEDVMRNAPVSSRNRLSYTLGLKPKDNSDHRISSIYYPKALGALLKVPTSPRSDSPVSPASKVVAVQSPQVHAGSTPDYFTGRADSPSLGRLTPDPKQPFSSQISPSESVVHQTTVRSPTLVLDSVARQSSMLTPGVMSPGLTSHPSVMAMATPPAELPALTEPGLAEIPRPPSRSRQPSESSLGEPGPEIADMESEPEVIMEDVEVAVIPPAQLNDTAVGQSASLVAQRVSPPPRSSSATLRQPEIHELGTGDGADIIERTTTHLPISVVKTLPGESQSATSESISENVSNAPEQPKWTAETDQNNASLDLNPKRATTDPVVLKNEATTKNIIAELEAIVPADPKVKPSASPIELEAPLQHFRLPPRTSTGPKTFGKDYASGTIRDRADFFKLPNEQVIKPGWKPRDFSGTKQQEPIRPLKLKLTKLDGRMVPVQVHTPHEGQPNNPQASTVDVDVINNMIEQITTTPLGSPVHERSLSELSSNSAQIWPESSSKRFGRPESAPAPPGPGGRVMVNPDYASAGQFEGERKQPKRSSGGSRGGIKELLSNSRRNSSEVSSKSMAQSSSRHSGSAKGAGPDMLTSAGKDVLWFKEEEQTPAPVGVTSS